MLNAVGAPDPRHLKAAFARGSVVELSLGAAEAGDAIAQGVKDAEKLARGTVPIWMGTANSKAGRPLPAWGIAQDAFAKCQKGQGKPEPVVCHRSRRIYALCIVIGSAIHDEWRWWADNVGEIPAELREAARPSPEGWRESSHGWLVGGPAAIQEIRADLRVVMFMSSLGSLISLPARASRVRWRSCKFGGGLRWRLLSNYDGRLAGGAGSGEWRLAAPEGHGTD